MESSLSFEYMGVFACGVISRGDNKIGMSAASALLETSRDLTKTGAISNRSRVSVSPENGIYHGGEWRMKDGGRFPLGDHRIDPKQQTRPTLRGEGRFRAECGESFPLLSGKRMHRESQTRRSRYPGPNPTHSVFFMFIAPISRNVGGDCKSR